MKEMTSPRIESRLIPLMIVNGLSLCTVERTGKKENLDHRMFWNLKLVNEREVTKIKVDLEMNEL